MDKKDGVSGENPEAPSFLSAEYNIIDKGNLSTDNASIRHINIALSNDEMLNGKPSKVMICVKERGKNFEIDKSLSDGYLCG